MLKHQNKPPVREITLNNYISSLLNNKNLKEVQNMFYFPVSLYSYYTDSEETNTFYNNIKEGNLSENNRFTYEILNSIDKKKFIILLNEIANNADENLSNTKISQIYIIFAKVVLYIKDMEFNEASKTLQNISLTNISSEIKSFFHTYYIILEAILSYYYRNYEKSKELLIQEEQSEFLKTPRKMCIGMCELEIGNFANAKIIFNESLQLIESQENKDLSNIVMYEFWIGVYKFKTGDFANAKIIFNESLQFLESQENKDILNIIMSKFWIGMCEFKTGDFANAKVIFNESLQCLESQENKNISIIDMSKFWIGVCELKIGNFANAKIIFIESLQFLESQENKDTFLIKNREDLIKTCEIKIKS